MRSLGHKSKLSVFIVAIMVVSLLFVSSCTINQKQGSSDTSSSSESSYQVPDNLTTKVERNGLSYKVDKKWKEEPYDESTKSTIYHVDSHGGFSVTDEEFPSYMYSTEEQQDNFIRESYGTFTKSYASGFPVYDATMDSSGKYYDRALVIMYGDRLITLYMSVDKEYADPYDALCDKFFSTVTIDAISVFPFDPNDTSAAPTGTGDVPSTVTILQELGDFTPSASNGTGNGVIKIPCVGKPCIMSVTYGGTGNFTVDACDSAGNVVYTMVDTTGPYHGVVSYYLIDQGDISEISVKSDGNWLISFSPLSDMDQAQNGATYTGDNVVYIDEDALSQIRFTNNGQSDFSLYAVGMHKTALLARGTGAYDDVLVWDEPKAFFIVESDGDWSLSW